MRLQIAVRLSPEMLEAIRQYVELHKPKVRDRTHLIELALTQYMKKPPK